MYLWDGNGGVMGTIPVGGRGSRLGSGLAATGSGFGLRARPRVRLAANALRVSQPRRPLGIEGKPGALGRIIRAVQEPAGPRELGADHSGRPNGGRDECSLPLEDSRLHLGSRGQQRRAEAHAHAAIFPRIEVAEVLAETFSALVPPKPRSGREQVTRERPLSRSFEDSGETRTRTGDTTIFREST
jgi:hypothetical protein